MPYRKTPVAARELGVAASHLHSILRAGKIPLPAKDSSGDYIWLDADIERARQVLSDGRPVVESREAAHAK